ncbi:GTP-binding protein (plasmid) [Sagittula stellata E-37]|uniref:Cobalamin synthesis protein, P47K n=1 Tax=Sagittula stellata (strain ATCC 700073 / DSM 11524 / E-37) TaxID=388399 RepID=A3K7X4_SAGS3|nr:GTP-binding protein [Sagittula stellata]EBA06746.1 cobalamin synthesis protein, P47K [Sagittula stellata E-37]
MQDNGLPITALSGFPGVGKTTVGRFDSLLIESFGMPEPFPVPTTLAFRDEAGHSLSDVARLHNMVTVADAINPLRDFSGHHCQSDKGETAGGGDMRTDVHLLTDQNDFADGVVLNQVTDAGPQRVDAVRPVVEAGIDMPKLQKRLDDCLMDGATGPDVLPDPPDPFPLWRRAEEAA